MEKSTFVGPLWFRLLLLCSMVPRLWSALPVSAQNTTLSKHRDPNALMLLAAKANGLSGSDLRPWRLKASYKLLDGKGDVIDQGTYEELRSGPSMIKRILTGSTYTQTDYKTKKGFMRTGIRKPPFLLLTRLGSELIAPLPPPKGIPYLDFTLKSGEIYGSKMDCLSPATPSVDNSERYCFDAGTSVLRAAYDSTLKTQYLHDNIIRFQDRFIASDLSFIQDGTLVLTAHLDTIGPLTTINDADFIPPSDAAPIPEPAPIKAQAFIGVGLIQ